MMWRKGCGRLIAGSGGAFARRLNSRQGPIRALIAIRRISRAVAYRLTTGLIRLLGAITPAPSDRHGVLLVPTDAGPGGYGDEAMVAAFFDVHQKMEGPVPLQALLTKPHSPWPLVPRCSQTVLGDLYAAWPSLRVWRFIRAANFAKVIYIGADTVDGGHDSAHLNRTIALLRTLAKRGATLAVVNMSLRPGAVISHQARLLLSSADEIHARDQGTASRLSAMGIKCSLAPDLAFAAPCPLFAPTLPSSRTRLARPERLPIIVNVSGHAIQFSSGNDIETIVIDAIAQDYAAHIPSGYLLLPHDLRESVGDVKPLLRIGRELNRRGLPCHVLSDPLDPREVRANLAASDFLITSRMHLAIAALSMGKVPLCITYFDEKFAGQFEWWGLPEWLLVSSQSVTTAGLLSRINRVRSNTSTLEAAIVRAGPSVRQAAVNQIVDVLLC